MLSKRKETDVTTLSDAIAKGQGIERPFKCTEHDDNMASASVNVVKGVWYCFACGSHGNVDKKRVPKVAELEAMMEPERLPKIYDEAFLDLYSDHGYWLNRFPAWVCWYLGLGEDPFTGDATFPVHTAGGLLAGVGRRKMEGEPRYVYPRYWSAASSLFGTWGGYQGYPFIVLVEGAADAAACWEVGCPALAVYGAGVHRPQLELISRFNPSVVLMGFDMDLAGERAAQAGLESMKNNYQVARVTWLLNDPAEAVPEDRAIDLIRAVSSTGYRQEKEVEDDLNRRAVHLQNTYQHHLSDTHN